MKKWTLTIIIVAMLCSMAGAVERPPVIDPNSLPFAIDISKVSGDILGVDYAKTNKAYSKVFKIQYEADPNALVSLSRSPGIGTITKINRDPNFPTVRRFRFDYQTDTPQVVYLNLTATVIGADGFPLRDNRCWIVKVEQPESPIIFVHNIVRNPTIYTHADVPKNLSRDWQRLRKLYGKTPTESQANEIIRNSGMEIPEYVKIP